MQNSKLIIENGDLKMQLEDVAESEEIRFAEQQMKFESLLTSEKELVKKLLDENQELRVGVVKARESSVELDEKKNAEIEKIKCLLQQKSEEIAIHFELKLPSCDNDFFQSVIHNNV